MPMWDICRQGSRQRQGTAIWAVQRGINLVVQVKYYSSMIHVSRGTATRQGSTSSGVRTPVSLNFEFLRTGVMASPTLCRKLCIVSAASPPHTSVDPAVTHQMYVGVQPQWCCKHVSNDLPSYSRFVTHTSEWNPQKTTSCKRIRSPESYLYVYASLFQRSICALFSQASRT